MDDEALNRYAKRFWIRVGSADAPVSACCLLVV